MSSILRWKKIHIKLKIKEIEDILIIFLSNRYKEFVFALI